jgi:hypothetical protein
VDELKEENNSLRDKLESMEQVRVNLVADKERRERDCRNLQTEVNRMNTTLCNFKNSIGERQIGTPLEPPTSTKKENFGTMNQPVMPMTGGNQQASMPWLSQNNTKERQALQDTFPNFPGANNPPVQPFHQNNQQQLYPPSSS